MLPLNKELCNELLYYTFYVVKVPKRYDYYSGLLLRNEDTAVEHKYIIIVMKLFKYEPYFIF